LAAIADQTLEWSRGNKLQNCGVAGHDCSVRLWNLETKTCIQEITAHRKKFDESIHDVAFHPSKPFIASVGADGVAKVFV
jgi:WD40 repeat protein